MQKVESMEYSTSRGTATLTYEGVRGTKQWVWRFADGTEARQTNTAKMVAYIREIKGVPHA